MALTDLRGRVLAVALAVLAGFVDALGFLALGGFFLSFMSGNSTRFGVGMIAGAPEAALAGLFIAAFVAGVVGGSLIGHWAGGERRRALLLFVAGLLAAAAVATQLGSTVGGLAAASVAMGAMNAVFERHDDIPFGVTYMTGALVKAGQRLALALRGGPRTEWIPFVLLWLGLVSGAAAGSAAYLAIGLDSLWLAALAAALLAPVAASPGS